MKKNICSKNRATHVVVVRFETDHGSKVKPYHFLVLDAAAADAVAVEIGNFSVIHGAYSAYIDAPESFVSLVDECFGRRFRKVEVADDPAGGLRLDGYLSDFYGQTFRISQVESAKSAAVRQIVPRRFDGKPVIWALGIDIGGETAKFALVRSGARVPFAESAVALRVDGNTYDSSFLEKLVGSSVSSLLDEAGISPSAIEAVGVSFAAAIRNGRASQSKAILDLDDVFGIKTRVFKRENFEKVRNLDTFLRSALAAVGVRDVPILVFNDGECEIAAEAPNSIMFKVGTTVASAYTDSNRRTDYLTEVGRCIIDKSDNAPEHRWSKICGASQVIGSLRLSTQCRQEGIKLDGSPITMGEAGHQLSEIIESNGPDAEAAKRMSIEMGGKISDLIVECAKHLGPIDRILLRGGLLMNCHPVGRIMRAAVQANLPPDLAAKIVDEEPSRHSGAVAAANLAARCL